MDCPSLPDTGRVTGPLIYFSLRSTRRAGHCAGTDDSPGTDASHSITCMVASQASGSGQR